MVIKQKVFFTLYSLLPKKYCLTVNEFAIVEEHKTVKGFNVSERLIDRSQCFNMIEVKKISAMLPRSWKKSFNNGIPIPTKMIRDTL